MNTKSDPASATIRAASGSNKHEGSFVISGTLGFDTVPDLMKQVRRLIAAADAVAIDFSEVVNCNSVALALILEITRITWQQKKTVCFHALPEEIRTFARAYSVEKELTDAGILC